jgi:HAD superfamily hydrolase (TIGR01509 family)
MLVFQREPFNSIRTAIFDMDGTLVDSTDAYCDVVEEILFCFGMEMTVPRGALIERMSHGKKLSDVLFPSEHEDREKAIERFNNLAMEAFKEAFARGEVELIAGVDRVFEELSHRGFSLAIVTSSMSEVVVPYLKTMKLHSYLDCVVAREDVPRLKPHPDPLLKCLKILSAEPCHAIYVGDSIIDIQAGKAAGTRTAGVLTGTTGLDHFRAEPPDVILDSVLDLLTILQ